MSVKFPTAARAALAVAAAGMLVACGGKPEGQGGPQGPAAVGVFAVQTQAVTLSTELPGRTVASRVAEVRPQTSGIVQKRLFEEGSVVKQGQALYQIDPATMNARLVKAQAQLQSTENLAKRYAVLREKNAISQQQYDDAMSAWRNAQADVELARIDTVYAKVLSPIAGRIGRSQVTEGALVGVGQAQPMATVQQIDPMHVDMQQSMTDILRLQAANAQASAKVRLVLEDGSVYPVPGTLKFSEVNVDESTGSVTLRATFANPDGLLRPGMFVRAQLQTGTKPEALLVPQQAVWRNTQGKSMVWVVGDDNVAKPRPVNAVRTVGNTWLVEGGLQSGERVITEGLQKLRGEMPVQPVPAQNVDIVTDLYAVNAVGKGD
ncbi:efflux RND transporter periplasmic adaptor subunit [Diaphorobacter sp. JS3050]|uniref:efflux RND transporter periplasmic adaptor subunit n=1 Tax=unclassified Diaphorobacter TaxID=2649760 RepID=UPI00155691E0|nr:MULTISPECIES: efflux RND transporter periplasmic adaptor subunit [unclassified Diaphorobacter]QJY31805.1 efflux RND transporter periplasmic adaptor subunit [Diaphorobacter sp. JS3050]QPN29489.1 efflux RND transporter periplasmic adaptor subunit [Diaphorobacter sp. JS3051]